MFSVIVFPSSIFVWYLENVPYAPVPASRQTQHAPSSKNLQASVSCIQSLSCHKRSKTSILRNQFLISTVLNNTSSIQHDNAAAVLDG